MKKIILALLLGVLALTTSCEPQELVHSDAQINQIITILHDGMGQPASVCLEQLEEIGITLPLVKSEQTNDYVLQNSKMWLSVSEQNDSVIVARYELFTTNTYSEGIADYIKMDNIVYGLNWEKWCGGVDGDAFDLSKHDAVNKEIEEYAATCKEHILGIDAFYEKKMGNMYFHAEMLYWGVAVGGMNPETGEAIGDKVKSQIRMSLSLDRIADSNLDDPTKEN